MVFNTKKIENPKNPWDDDLASRADEKQYKKKKCMAPTRDAFFWLWQTSQKHRTIYRRRCVSPVKKLGFDEATLFDGEVDFDFNSGASVSLSSDGRTVAIGAAQSRGTSFRAGHTRVYTLNQADEWVQVGAYLHGEEGDLFGHSSFLSLQISKI